MRNWQFDAFSPGSLTVPLSGIEVRGRVGEVRSASAANTKPPCSFVYLIKSTSTVAFWWLNQRLSATLPQNAGRALSGREYSPLSTSRPGQGGVRVIYVEFLQLQPFNQPAPQLADAHR